MWFRDFLFVLLTAGIVLVEGETRNPLNETSKVEKLLDIPPIDQEKDKGNLIFDNVTSNAIKGEVNELEYWVAPLEVQKKYQYYHSGFDEEGRPIWIVEIGRWDFPWITKGGPERVALIDKNADQAAYRIIKSQQERSTVDNPVTDAKIILDMDGFGIPSLAHLPSVSYVLQLLFRMLNVLDQVVNVVFIVNTNSVAHSLINLARPVVGRVMERVEVYGTNSKKWIPKLLQHFPKNQIPSWYGGIENFKPLKVYG